MSFKIRKIFSREILDSRGNPTIECDVILSKNIIGRASVPSGASTGKYEAHELRDGDKRFHGLGMLTAINNINSIITKELVGIDSRKQSQLDALLIKLDGTENKSYLGANTILAVSLATAKASALALRQPLYQYLVTIIENNKRQKESEFILPIPFCNLINGGKHAGNNLKIQEFMIVPAGFDSFRSATTAVSEVYHELKSLLLKKFSKQAINVGDEGGFAPQISSPEEVLTLLESVVEATSYSDKIKFAIDAAASEFYHPKEKKYEIEPSRMFTASELSDYYLKLVKEFPVISIEDPFEEESFSAFLELTKKTVTRNIQIVGDDLLVSNVNRIKEAIRLNACNCLLLKVNQIGTLTETIEAARLAMNNNWKVMVSHRSGETEDTFIADLAVALGCGQIKLGAPARGERTAKYNQILRLEEMINSKYAGKYFIL